MIKMIFLVMVLSFVSCSHSGNSNMVLNNEVSMTGGEFKDISWEDSLDFKKASWFIGATQAYEVYIARLDKTSPFSNWLGSDKSKLDKCDDFYVALIYSNRFSTMYHLVSSNDISRQIEGQGFESIAITSLKSYLASHHTFSQWRLKNHDVEGYCYRKGEVAPESIELNMPGFKSVFISL